MIIILNKKNCTAINKIYENGENIETSNLKDKIIVTCDDDNLLYDIIKSDDAISYIALENSNYPLVSNHSDIINIGEKKFVSNKDFIFICGPCSIESKNQFADNNDELNNINEIAGIRCGTYKPRTSPYGFQGLHSIGYKIIESCNPKKLKVGEITSIQQVKDCPFDIIQIGTRNMQNFELLKAVSKIDKPIILKRGMGATIEEFLNSAEYLLQNNPNVILCERGIKTFENSTRATLDLSAIPVIKSKTKLPIIVDPSHAAGKREYIENLCYAAIAAGADGLLIESAINPNSALSDGRQTVDYRTLNKIINKSMKLLELFDKKIYER